MLITSFEEKIGEYKIDNEKVIKSTIEKLYLIKKHHSNTDGNSNIRGWQKELSLNEIPSIVDIIGKNFEEYIRTYKIFPKIEYRINKFFCNINPPGASNIIHCHKVGEFSGVFYLKAEENAGDLIVMNPFPNILFNTLCVTKENYNNRRWTPFAGLGLFWNSNLMHYTDINRSDTDRISIAFHIKINTI